MSDDNLIDQYKQIHATRTYGDTSIKNLRYLRPQVQVLAPKSILDFGCGRSRLVDVLGQSVGAEIKRYDPAIPEFSTPPQGVYDLLTNIDVLEHVPEDKLDTVVGQMASLCRNAIIVIDMRPAEAVLPNGENAHCTLRSQDWWQQYLGKHFKYVEPIRVTRTSRAAFRTWSLDGERQRTLKKLLFREKLSYAWGRLFGRK
jgi:hypothetical protein